MAAPGNILRSSPNLLAALVVGSVFLLFSSAIDGAIRYSLLAELLNARPQPAWQNGAVWLTYLQITKDEQGNLHRSDKSDTARTPYSVRYVMLRDLDSLVERRLADPVHEAEERKAYKLLDSEGPPPQEWKDFQQREANEMFGYYGSGWYGHADFQPGHNAKTDDGKIVYVDAGYSHRGGIYLRGGPSIDGLTDAFRRPHGVIWHDYDVELFTHGTLLVLFFLALWALSAVPTWFLVSASVYVTLLSLFMYFSTVVVERAHPLFLIADLALPIVATVLATYRFERARAGRTQESNLKTSPVVDQPAPGRTLDRSAEVLESAAKRMTPSPESARLLRAAQALRTADSIRVLKEDVGDDFDDPAIQKALRDAGIRLD